MAAIAMKDLLEAGVHFGHQTKRWNPKMKEYIFGERNGIYILDLGKTVKLFRRSRRVRQPASPPKAARSCSSAPSARRKDVIAEEAQRCGMFYVNERWLGGLLTNFATIQRSLGRLRDLEAMATDGRYDTLSKKEIARNEKERKQAAEEPRRHPRHVPPARRGLHRRHQEGTDCRRRGAQAEDSGHRHRRHQLRSGRSRLRHSRQRRRAALDPAVRVADCRRGDRRPRHEAVGRRRQPRARPATKAATDEGRALDRAPGTPRPRSGAGVRASRSAPRFSERFSRRRLLDAGPALFCTDTETDTMATTITAAQVKKLRDQTGAA